MSDASKGSEARLRVKSSLVFFILIFSLFLPEVLLEEVDADGLLVVVGEDAAAVSLDHARLAHRPVPHDHHLRRQSHTFALDRAHPMFRVGLRKIPRPFIAHKNPPRPT